MDFVEFKFWKLVAVCVGVFLVVFFYGLFTGRSLLEDSTARTAGKERPGPQD